MKPYLIFFTLVLLTLSCASMKTVTKVDELAVTRNYESEKYLGPKKKLAVTKFINATRFGKRRLGDHISDVLITELSKTGRFILLERERVDQILDQYILSQSGLTEGTLEQISLIDADFIITGTVTHYAVTTTGTSGIIKRSKIQKAEVAADVRIINVRTGEIILAETGGGIAEKKYEQAFGLGESGGYDESLEMDAFRAAVITVTENIISSIDKFPWMCNVVDISGSKLYIDAGRKSNLNIGDVLSIYQQGKAIKDLSGKLIGYEEIFIDEGRVIDYLGEDGAVVVLDTEITLQMPLICKIDMKNNQ